MDKPSTSSAVGEIMNDKQIVEAEHLLVLMKQNYRISRNLRAEWYFRHLNQPIGVEDPESSVWYFTWNNYFPYM